MLCTKCGYTSYREGNKCLACGTAIVPQETALAAVPGFTLFGENGGFQGGADLDFGVPAGADFDNLQAPDFAEVSIPDLPEDFTAPEPAPGVEEFNLDLSEAESFLAGAGFGGGDAQPEPLDLGTSMPDLGDLGTLDLGAPAVDLDIPQIETEAPVLPELDLGSPSEPMLDLGVSLGEETAPALEEISPTTEISLDEAPVLDLQPDLAPAEPQLEFSAEPALELTAEPTLSLAEEPALELTEEPRLTLTEEPALELSAEPELELKEEPALPLSIDEPEIKLDLDLGETPPLNADTAEAGAASPNLDLDLDLGDLKLELDDHPEEEKK